VGQRQRGAGSAKYGISRKIAEADTAAVLGSRESRARRPFAVRYVHSRRRARESRNGSAEMGASIAIPRMGVGRWALGLERWDRGRRKWRRGLPRRSVVGPRRAAGPGSNRNETERNGIRSGGRPVASRRICAGSEGSAQSAKREARRKAWYLRLLMVDETDLLRIMGARGLRAQLFDNAVCCDGGISRDGGRVRCRLWHLVENVAAERHWGRAFRMAPCPIGSAAWLLRKWQASGA